MQQRALPVTRAKHKAPGVDDPLQLTGPLHGVALDMPRGIYGVLDCRLALLLDDLSKELGAFGVSAVVVNNTFRPGSVLQSKAPPAAAAAPERAPPKKRGQARTARRQAVDPAQLSQHARGLAIDIMEFRLAEGQALNVERDWHGPLGTAPCGPDARIDVGETDAAAVRLRNLVCALARAGYCNHLITPSRDAAHRNHLHCDIQANANEVMVE